jgi:hypothetical protein
MVIAPFQPAVRFLALAAVLLTASACGVKQNNSRIKKDTGGSTLLSIFGPFFSSSQGGNSVTTNPSTCGSSNRPCIKMRASVGLPYQFDVNTNTRQGPLVAGTTYPPGSNPYTTQISGPGKIKPTVSVRADQPQLENKDLKMMQRQTASGEHNIP